MELQDRKEIVENIRYLLQEEDVPKLKREGIRGIFGPGTPCEDIVAFIKKNVKR